MGPFIKGVIRTVFLMAVTENRQGNGFCCWKLLETYSWVGVIEAQKEFTVGPNGL